MQTPFPLPDTPMKPNLSGGDGMCLKTPAFILNVGAGWSFIAASFIFT